MSELKDAAENIKRLSVQFKSLLILADHIDKVESIEGDLPKLEAARDALKAESEDLASKNVALQDALFLHQQQAKGLLDGAHKEAADINIRALEEAESILDQAKVKGEELKQSLLAEYADANEKIKAANDRLIELQTKIAEDELKLEQIQQQLAAIKGAI